MAPAPSMDSITPSDLEAGNERARSRCGLAGMAVSQARNVERPGGLAPEPPADCGRTAVWLDIEVSACWVLPRCGPKGASASTVIRHAAAGLRFLLVALGRVLMSMVMIGVDPHKGSHTAVAIGLGEEPLGRVRAGACPSQATQLLGWRRRAGAGLGWRARQRGGPSQTNDLDRPSRRTGSGGQDLLHVPRADGSRVTGSMRHFFWSRALLMAA
jgi:hypothetical protein